jgi:tetratricopeptide (TPR) repeat protein
LAISYLEEALSICRQIGDQQGEGYTLGNLGYIHFDIGDYAKAGRYSRQALEICRQIDDRPGEATALTSLCLLFHRMEQNKQALQYGQGGLSLSQSHNDSATQALAHTWIGHAYTHLENWDEARGNYRMAVEIWEKREEPVLALEALAGLARIELHQDQLPAAREYVEAILTHLQPDVIPDLYEPYRVYLTCYQVLSTSQDPRAEGILTSAHDLLGESANRIRDKTIRRSYLQGVNEHHEIIKLHSKLETSRPFKQISINLPQKGASQGRALREDEFISVLWTVAAPDDLQIEKKTDRRRARLLRLLAEAEAQGGVPRDQDLAAALDVSLRTIRRDIAALRDQGHPLPTRRRKMAS